MIRPILGERVKSLHDIVLPCFASYKLDGWRGIWQGLEFFSRSGKAIPNRQLRNIAAKLQIPPGWDGEIIVGEPNLPTTFNTTDRFCKTALAITEPERIKFFIFDNALGKGPFHDRISHLHDVPPLVFKLDQHLIESYEALEEFEADAVAKGYEGVVTRSPTGRYKNGRSTLREQLLLKVKRYIDEEVTIIRLEEKMHNANPAEVSELGYTKRSSHRDGKVPANTLGAVIVDWRGHELGVGTGWDQRTARELWAVRDKLPGTKVTIRYSPSVKTLPRQPVWKGIRWDL